jgi:hypothetical protein
MLAKRELSAREISGLDKQLLLGPEHESQRPSKRLEHFRRSAAYQQLHHQEERELWSEAQRIGRLIIREGGLSSAEILQKVHGLTKDRLDVLTPLILGLNLLLQLRVGRLKVSPGNRSIAETQELLRGVRGKHRTFEVLPAPEVAARVSALNRTQEDRARLGLIIWSKHLGG